MSASAVPLASGPSTCRRSESHIHRIPVGRLPDFAEHVGISQDPGRAGQGSQRRALRVGWKQHQDHKVDPLPINGIKRDRVLETGEHTGWPLQRVKTRVREGNAIPHARGPELLPLQNSGEDVVGAEVQRRCHVVGEGLKRARLSDARKPTMTSAGDNSSLISTVTLARPRAAGPLRGS